jgi:hypothetical protein
MKEPVAEVREMVTSAPVAPVAPVTPVAPTAPAAPAAPQDQRAAPAPKSNGKGRKPKSFVLCINCAPVRGAETKGARKVYDLSKIMHEYGVQCAQSYGLGSFAEIDIAQRRDLLVKAAPAIAEQFEQSIVMAYGVPHESGDFKTLVDAITPLAGMVICAIGYLPVQ